MDKTEECETEEGGEQTNTEKCTCGSASLPFRISPGQEAPSLTPRSAHPTWLANIRRTIVKKSPD